MKEVITWTRDTRTPVKSYEGCKTVFEARNRRALELGIPVCEVMGRRAY